MARTNHRVLWTPEAVETMRQLARDGRSPREIARQLGRTEEAIRNRAAREGISFLS